MPEHTCGTCKHWKYPEEASMGIETGVCFCHPPTRLYMKAGDSPGGYRSLWPTPASTDSCGQWQTNAECRPCLQCEHLPFGCNYCLVIDDPFGGDHALCRDCRIPGVPCVLFEERKPDAAD